MEKTFYENRLRSFIFRGVRTFVIPKKVKKEKKKNIFCISPIDTRQFM